MDTKKVLQQLLKIADNQQKIINKLAQNAGLATAPQGGAQTTGTNVDVSSEIAGLLAQIPEAAKSKAGIQSAQMGSQTGFLDVKVKFPGMKSMDDPNATAALNKLRAAVKGANLRDPSGKPLQVTQSNVVGVYG